MYRVDNGDWISEAEYVNQNLRAVGTDFRGLPIVHIGRGRPNKSIIKLLSETPNTVGEKFSSTLVRKHSATLVKRPRGRPPKTGTPSSSERKYQNLVHQSCYDVLLIVLSDLYH